MNKEEILRRSRNEKNDELILYIDNKAFEMSMYVLCFLSMILMFISFMTSYQKEIFYTSLTLMTTFSMFYSFIRYYYLKYKISLCVGIVSFVVMLYAMYILLTLMV